MEHSRLVRAVTAIVLLLASEMAFAQTPNRYVVGCLSETRDGWSLLGPGNQDGPPQIAKFITSPANFGVGGRVANKTFSVVELREITPAALTMIDIFHLVFDNQGFPTNERSGTGHIGLIPDLTNDELDALESFVAWGGALLIFVGQTDQYAPLADRVLRRFGMRLGEGWGAGQAVATAAMPEDLLGGLFNWGGDVTWRANVHSSLQVEDRDRATVLLAFNDGGFASNEMLMGSLPDSPGIVLAFADYFNSYTSVVSLVGTSTNFDRLVGNVFNFVADRVAIDASRFPISMVSSTPIDGYIDPRSVLGGIDQITLTFNRQASDADGTSFDASSFQVTSASELDPPGVFSVETTADRKTVVVTLDWPIAVGVWTTLIADVAGSDGTVEHISVSFAHLPGDVNQDGVVDIRDATAFGEEFRGQRRLELIDLNRSGTVTISDATEFGRLWYGTGDAARSWNGASLSERPTQ